MVIILVLAFFMSATVTIYTLFRSGDTRVPNVVGRSEAEAQQIAIKAGLIVKIQRRSDDKIPADTVIETRPGPNSSVKKDSSLTIVVSSGPAQTRSEMRYSPHEFFIVSISGAMRPDHSTRPFRNSRPETQPL
jgi:serine/threonine-protein kinase